MKTKNAILKILSLLGSAFILLIFRSLGGLPMVFLALFWAAAGYFIWVSVKYKFKTVHAGIGIFLLSFLFQSCYSFYVRILGEGDLQFYFNTAVKIAQNSFQLESLYNATFPGTVTYPSILAVMFKIFGIHRIVPVFLNQMVMSATIVMVYLFIRHRHSHLCGEICAMLLATHPFVIIYCNTANAEILYGACILWSFVTFYFAHVKYKATGQKLWFAFPALFLGLSQLFRPLGIVMLTALLLYVLFFTNIKGKDILIISSTLISGFLLFNLLCGAIVKGITTYNTPQSAYGWNLYIGASESGRWNIADGDEFKEVIAAAKTPSEIQKYFADKGFERYSKMGLGIFSHGINKLFRLNSADYMMQETFMLTQESASKHTFNIAEYALPIRLYYAPILLLALTFCFLSFVRLFRSKFDELIILPLYTVGSFAVFVFLEVAPRYAVSYHIMFTVLAFETALCMIKHLRRYPLHP